MHEFILLRLTYNSQSLLIFIRANRNKMMHLLTFEQTLSINLLAIYSLMETKHIIKVIDFFFSDDGRRSNDDSSKYFFFLILFL